MDNAALSACVEPAHTEAWRRGDRERSAHKACWTGLHTSPKAGASRDTAGPDYSRQNSSTSALIRRIRADPCTLPASRATPACAGAALRVRAEALPECVEAPAGLLAFSPLRAMGSMWAA